MKRKLSLLLVMVMMLSMVFPVFAADDEGSIKVANPNKNEEYTLYQIFDGVWAGDSVAYTIKNNSPWYDQVDDAAGPFNLIDDGTRSFVGLKDEKTDADVRTWLAGLTIPSTAAGSTKSGEVEVKWTDLGYGYYLISTAWVGEGDDPIENRLVTVTNVNKDVVVFQKNDMPNWEEPEEPEEDPEDPDQPDKPENYESPQPGKNVSADDYWYSPTSTAQMGDDVYFKINAYVPKYYNDQQVYSYTFTDELQDGLVYKSLTSIKLDGIELTTDQYTWTVDSDNKNIELVVHAYEGFNYGYDFPEMGSLEIKFMAVATNESVHVNVNEANMDWDSFDPIDEFPQEPVDPDDPDEPPVPEKPVTPNDPKNPPEEGDTPPPSKTETYIFGFDLLKVDEEKEVLEGALFQIYGSEERDDLVPVVFLKEEEGVKYYRVATDEDDPDGHVNIEAGQGQVFGLDAKTYYLEEVGAPDGYNKLADRVEVVIKKSLADDNGILEVPVEVVNKTGAVLPETGGIGTTIFYVVGGLIMLLSVVILVTRKKMSSN